MGFGQAISSGFAKYFVWRGRASRSEFWYWILFTIIGSLICALIDQLLGFHVVDVERFYSGGTAVSLSWVTVGWVQTIFGLLVLLPTIAVTVRRLHDTNNSGWWWWLQLLNFLCFIGTLILIFGFWIKEGDPYDNRYGPPVR